MAILSSPVSRSGVPSLGAERVPIGMPVAVSRSVRTRDHHDIAVGISHPKLPVIRPAVTVRGISVPWQHDVHTHRGCALYDRVKIVNLEPQQDSVPIWFVVRVAYGTVMVLHFEAV